ncbi:3-oxoacyl-ACP reductase family protein [Limosilactobacillus ingluviei]|uniref:3-oxoacyl-ACP reductase family protein n=1 Tax=Limosilactobacillus ingluviei TaxID=148604 RepID=UPI0024BA10B6|nr:3-oxoacyl-ACP reductase family protein [Limosilactobacillus ingluviei]
MELQNKVALITGSTRGIGLAIAQEFLAAGAKVILNGRGDLPAEVAANLSGDFQYVAGDLGTDEGIAQVAHAALAAYGQIDILVNNAGITRDKLLLGMKPADFDAVLAVDLRAPMLLTQLVFKKMLKQRAGVVINLASVVGLHGNAGQANYAAAKAGLVGFTKTLAREGAARGVRANAIAPGMIDSAMTQALSEKVQAQLIAEIPLHRLGQPNEIAHAARFLVESDYVTGQTMVVDGGMTM